MAYQAHAAELRHGRAGPGCERHAADSEYGVFPTRDSVTCLPHEATQNPEDKCDHGDYDRPLTNTGAIGAIGAHLVLSSGGRAPPTFASARAIGFSIHPTAFR